MVGAGCDLGIYRAQRSKSGRGGTGGGVGRNKSPVGCRRGCPLSIQGAVDLNEPDTGPSYVDSGNLNTGTRAEPRLE